MQIAQENATASASLGLGVSEASNAPRTPYADYKIIRRNGAAPGAGVNADTSAVPCVKAGVPSR